VDVDVDTLVLPTLQEVERAVKQLNGDSAAIGVPLFPLRWAATPALLQQLHQSVCDIWRTGVVPEEFCVVEAVALPKPVPAGAAPAYRIIGVGGALAKVFRLVMNNRLLAQTAHKLSCVQFGFLPHRSTE